MVVLIVLLVPCGARPGQARAVRRSDSRVRWHPQLRDRPLADCRAWSKMGGRRRVVRCGCRDLARQPDGLRNRSADSGGATAGDVGASRLPCRCRPQPHEQYGKAIGTALAHAWMAAWAGLCDDAPRRSPSRATPSSVAISCTTPRAPASSGPCPSCLVSLP